MGKIDEKVFNLMSTSADKTDVDIFKDTVKEEVVEFSKEDFRKTLESVKHDTTKKLKELYPGKKVEVILSDHTRDIKTQMKYEEEGKSRTSLGLHNFGAAGDYIIKIDDVIQEGRTNITLAPYRVLGSVAKEKGLFWGYGWDSGHVAKTRFVDEFLTQYPEQAFKNKDVRYWYNTNFDNTEAKYSPVMSTLDKIYGRKNPNRAYFGEERTIDPLLKAFND